MVIEKTQDKAAGCQHDAVPGGDSSGLGDVQAAHGVGAVEVGQRAGDPQRAVPGAGREAEPLGGAGQQGAALGVGLGDRGQQLRRRCRRCSAAWTSRAPGRTAGRRSARLRPSACSCDCELGQPLALDGARRRHAGGDIGRAFGRRRQGEVGGLDPRHLDAEVDAVEQRAREPALVVDARSAGAAAGAQARRASRSGRGSSPPPAGSAPDR